MDLRTLGFGETLDRTFSLYQNYFLLFAGITAMPYLVFLAFGVLQAMLTPTPAPRNSRNGAMALQSAAGYFAIFEAAWNQQTPGKRLARIRVMKDSGRPARRWIQ